MPPAYSECPVTGGLWVPWFPGAGSALEELNACVHKLAACLENPVHSVGSLGNFMLDLSPGDSTHRPGSLGSGRVGQIEYWRQGRNTFLKEKGEGKGRYLKLGPQKKRVDRFPVIFGDC